MLAREETITGRGNVAIWKRPCAMLSAALVLAGGLGSGANGYAAASSSGKTLSHLSYGGTTRLARSSGSPATTDRMLPDFVGHQPKNPNRNHVAADGVPGVLGNAISSGQLGNFGGFAGINQLQQLSAGTDQYANSQFTLEPPDQGLCVGNGEVVEAVNLAVRAFDTSGNPLSAPTALNQFFHLKPAATNTNPPVFGDFLSDPRCYFDPADKRWFLVVSQLGLDPVTAAFAPPAHLEIAVSQTSDAVGAWNLYSIDITDDGSNGTPTHANCPCFGDQPLIGADAYGFYVSTNEYRAVSLPFNGAQIYAMSKAKLENGTGGTVVAIDAGPMLLAEGGLAYTVQPASAPSAAANEVANGGTEYFVSGLDFGVAPALGVRENRLAVWAMTNTSSVGTPVPSISLTNVVINSELYVQPPNAEQKPGDLLLGALLHDPLSLVASNEDRLQQVVFAGGKLWTAQNTAIQPQNGPTRVGLAYFILAPSDPHGTLTAAVVKQGYVAVNQENLLFPSIGVTSSGKGVIAFSLVGPDFYPSAAYASVDATNGVRDVHVAAPGQGPEDGFTGYREFGGVVSRWGDYSAAVASGDTVWFATEYIANPATDTTTRSLFANWATFVGHAKP